VEKMPDLRTWPLWGVLLAGAGWVVVAGALSWAYLRARLWWAMRGAEPDAPFYFRADVPGGLLLILGPPLLLAAAWLYLRIVRPAT